jgi:hypothetical protein
MTELAPPMGIPTTRSTFRAATWNVYHGTKPSELAPLLAAQQGRGVSIFLFQELSQAGVRDMVVGAGLHLVFQPRQYGIAYNPDVWTELASGGIRLSDTAYYAKGGDNKQYSDAVWAILGDHAGRTLTALSYHTPAHVQVADPPQRRLQATRESMATLRRVARTAHTDACLFGGDDNVDEARGFRDRFRFMLGGPLKQVRAPAPTHGRRRIDDFRTTGLRALEGSVSPGGGDHRIHTRLFRWDQ